MAEAMRKAAAVGGVAAMWTYFTLKTTRLWVYFTHETLKICDKIVFPTPQLRWSTCESCRFNFITGADTQEPYVCQECERKENEELEIRYGDEKAT